MYKNEEEYKLAKENFMLDGNTVLRIKTSKAIGEGKAQIRAGKNILTANRIKWILQHNQPVPEHGYVRDFGDSLMCYHRVPSIIGRCDCGHNSVIKEYLTDKCYCAKCLNGLEVQTATPGDDCPICNGFLIARSANFGMFLGCSNLTRYPDSCHYMCFLDKRHCLYISPEDL